MLPRHRTQISRAQSETWLASSKVAPGVFLIRYVMPCALALVGPLLIMTTGRKYLFRTLWFVGEVEPVLIMVCCVMCLSVGRRMSSVDPKNFTLSLRCEKEVVHFQIVNHGESWYVTCCTDRIAPFRPSHRRDQRTRENPCWRRGATDRIRERAAFGLNRSVDVHNRCFQ